jgi:Fic family protein
MIALSPTQVDQVVRAACGAGSMSVLLSGLDDVRESLLTAPRQLQDNRLCRSLLAGLLMLACFPADGSYLANAEIARAVGMHPSTSHRYVSTLVAVGLLERDPGTRRFKLVQWHS